MRRRRPSLDGYNKWASSEENGVFLKKWKGVFDDDDDDDDDDDGNSG
jgi:hypothetical protein